MNLHAIAGPIIAAVNPMIDVTIQVSTGATVAADGTRTPSYAAPVTIPGQVQPMTFRDLVQVEGLNLNGTKRAIYLNGRVDGIVRVDNKGGDLITIAGGINSGVWLVAMVLEAWPDWVKVAVTLQDGA